MQLKELQGALKAAFEKFICDFFDQYVSATNPGRNQAPAEENPILTRFSEVVDEEKDLWELLNRFQRHTKCSENYRLRKDKTTGVFKCRYNFPFELSDESFIRKKKDEHEFVSKRNDEYLKRYNPSVTRIWRANTDIQATSSEHDLINYIAKYVGKSESSSKDLKDIIANLSDLGISENDPAKKIIHKVLMSTLKDRDCSGQEVCHNLLSQPLVYCSREYVNLRLEDHDWLSINKEALVRNQIKSNTTLLQKYKSRPILYE